MVASVRFVGMMLGLLLKVSFLWLVANAHFLSVVPVTNMREKMALNAVLSAGKDTCATEVSQSALPTPPPFSFLFPLTQDHSPQIPQNFLPIKNTHPILPNGNDFFLLKFYFFWFLFVCQVVCFFCVEICPFFLFGPDLVGGSGSLGVMNECRKSSC
jgi:hypothetical protein